MLTIDEIKNRVADGLEKNYSEEFRITPRIINSFSTADKVFIEKGQIKEKVEDIDRLIGFDISKEFVKNRQPLVSKVSSDVLYDVYDYFRGDMPDVEVYSVARASNHPDDTNLYSVVGRDKRDGEFMCWTSWNESTKSLNYGHYGYKDYNACHHIIAEHFNDITDDVVRYGPDASIVMLSDEQRQEFSDKRKELHSNDKTADEKLVSMEEVVVNRQRRGR